MIRRPGDGGRGSRVARNRRCCAPSEELPPRFAQLSYYRILYALMQSPPQATGFTRGSHVWMYASVCVRASSRLLCGQQSRGRCVDIRGGCTHTLGTSSKPTTREPLGCTCSSHRQIIVPVPYIDQVSPAEAPPRPHQRARGGANRKRD